MDKKNEFEEKLAEFVKDIELRSEFEFDEFWLKVQRDPVLCAIVDPRLMANVKKIMKHGYIAGAQAAVLNVIERVANELCE